MKIVRVQYTVQVEFVEQNKKNIQAVMDELRSIGNNDIKYSAYQRSDNKAFMHLVHYNSEEAQELPSNLESFKHFQKELKENLEVPPNAEDIEIVDSSTPVF